MPVIQIVILEGSQLAEGEGVSFLFLLHLSLPEASRFSCVVFTKYQPSVQLGGLYACHSDLMLGGSQVAERQAVSFLSILHASLSVMCRIQ